MDNSDEYESLDNSMTIGSQDTFSTDSNDSLGSLASFIVETDEDTDGKEEFKIQRRAVKFVENKRDRENHVEGEDLDLGSSSEREESHARKYRRLYLRPRSIYDGPSEPPSEEISSGTLQTPLMLKKRERVLTPLQQG